MASKLPFIPWVTFTILEPLSLLAGWAGPLVSTSYFVSNQLPSSASPVSDHTQYPLRPHEEILALQLGNCYLLLAFVGLFVLNTTTELKVVKAYLLALWLGDIGHVLVTTHVIGLDMVWKVGTWNAVTWGNIGATVFLFSVRSLYFAGAFGDVVAAGKIQRSRNRAKAATSVTKRDKQR